MKKKDTKRKIEKRRKERERQYRKERETVQKNTERNDFVSVLAWFTRRYKLLKDCVLMCQRPAVTAFSL